jgi:NAD(P)-dependent dehydrogenase (short-subunit alcohol dehydrogenase family)
MVRFDGKLAIVSGGASGMGAATAKRIVEEGGSVVTLDINEKGGQEVAHQIGNSCEFFKADVTTEPPSSTIRLAVAAPIPEAPPETIANFPSNLTIIPPKIRLYY